MREGEDDGSYEQYQCIGALFVIGHQLGSNKYDICIKTHAAEVRDSMIRL